MCDVQDRVWHDAPSLWCSTGPYVKVRVTRGPPFRTSQYCRTFIPRVTIFVTPYSTVWNWRVLRPGPMPFYFPCWWLPFCLPLFSFSQFYDSIGWYFKAGVFGLIGCYSLSPSLALTIFFNNDNNNIETDS